MRLAKLRNDARPFRAAPAGVHLVRLLPAPIGLLSLRRIHNVDKTPPLKDLGWRSSDKMSAA